MHASLGALPCPAPCPALEAAPCLGRGLGLGSAGPRASVRPCRSGKCPVTPSPSPTTRCHQAPPTDRQRRGRTADQCGSVLGGGPNRACCVCQKPCYKLYHSVAASRSPTITNTSSPTVATAALLLPLGALGAAALSVAGSRQGIGATPGSRPHSVLGFRSLMTFMISSHSSFCSRVLHPRSLLLESGWYMRTAWRYPSRSRPASHGTLNTRSTCGRGREASGRRGVERPASRGSATRGVQARQGGRVLRPQPQARRGRKRRAALPPQRPAGGTRIDSVAPPTPVNGRRSWLAGVSSLVNAHPP